MSWLKVVSGRHLSPADEEIFQLGRFDQQLATWSLHCSIKKRTSGLHPSLVFHAFGKFTELVHPHLYPLQDNSISKVPNRGITGFGIYQHGFNIWKMDRHLSIFLLHFREAVKLRLTLQCFMVHGKSHKAKLVANFFPWQPMRKHTHPHPYKAGSCIDWSIGEPEMRLQQ